jgi:photosystem II stability/assembly factor-like uncharacterized protein
MKKLICSFVLLASITLAARAQWTRHKEGSHYFNCVKFTSASTVLAGNGSGLLRSTNGGTTFSPVNTPLLTSIYGLHFFDANNGIGVGSVSGNTEMIFRTSDGGVNWSVVYFNNNGPLLRTLNSVHFPTATTGYAVGHNGRILKSTDGGGTWTAVSTPTTAILNSVYFTSAATGYIAGNGVLLSTTNGGVSWTTTSLPHNFESVQFTSADTGFVTAEHGILKTVNHGLTWTLKTVNRTDRFTGLKMIDGTVGFACADNGVYKTENAGEFWALQPSSDFTGMYAAIDFADANTGMAVGFEGHTTSTSTSGSPVPKNDADLVTAVFPGTEVCPGMYNILFSIRNNGMNNLTSSVINWTLNGTVQPPYTWMGNLPPDSATPYLSLPCSFGPKMNRVTMWAESPNNKADDDLANDTIQHDLLLARLTGTYTIGGGNPDFVTIADAISALTFYGPCGDVTFRIRNGSYVLPATLINAYADTLAANRKVVFESESGDSSQVVISTDGIGLNSVRQITFRKLSLVTTSGYTLISLSGNARNIAVSGCRLNAVTATGSFATEGIIEAPAAGNYDSLLITRNTFTGGMYGVKISSYSADPKGCYIDISNNVLDSQLNTVIFLAGTNSGRIVSNTISNVVSDAKGIAVYYSDLGMLINRNRILLDHGTGISMNNCNGPATEKKIISNNFIRTGNPQRTLTGGILGVYFHSSSNISFLHNTLINKKSLTSGSFTSYSFLIDDTDTTRAPAFMIRNNIISNEMPNGAIYRVDFYKALQSDIDYLARKVFSSITNNAYLQKTNTFAQYLTSDIFNLTEWNSYDLDEHSFNTDPQIAHPDDLHILPDRWNYRLNAAAAPLPEVTEDIDGNPRDVNTPDIGADEFETVARDVAMMEAPFSGVFCAGSNPVNVNVQNFGNDTVTTMRIGWKRNGILQVPFLWSGTLIPGAKITRLAIGNMIPGITPETIVAWIDSVNHGTDIVQRNDSVSFSGMAGGLSGTFTIGGTTPDYATLNAAVNDLKAKGVCGPVLFRIRAGTYNEQLLIKGIKGSDSANTVIFTSENGDSNSVTIAYNPVSVAANYVIRFDSAVNYITLNKITVTCSAFQPGGFGYLVSVINSSHHITISNCVLKTTGTAFNVQAYAISSENSDFCRFSSNYVSNTYYGIQVYSPMLTNSRSTGNMVNGNVFSSQKYWFINVENSTGIEINQNSGNSTFPNNSTKTCLYVSNTFGASRILNNQFLSTTATGMRTSFSNNRGCRWQRMLVGNNMVNTLVFSQCAFVDVVNNSIYSISSSGLGIDGRNFRVVNNIMQTSGGFPITVSPQSQLDVLDHNCYYNASSANLVSYYYDRYTNFDKWKLKGFDAHSWNINPQYVSSTDLHINTINTGRLKKSGTGYDGLAADVDGQVRDLLHPDIGADEFVFNALFNDAGVIAIQNPTPFCDGANPVWVQLRNYGKDTLRSATINCSINGTLLPAYSFTGLIPPLSTGSYVNIGTYNFASNTNHTIISFTSAPNSITDSLTANDSITLGPVHTLLSGVYTIGGTSPHYSTIALAVQDLVQYGICGPVEFRIRNGVYTDAILIPEIKGSSSVNTITFTGESMDSSLVQLKVNAFITSEAALKLEGADHITFRHITIWNDGFMTQGKNIWMTSQADSIAFLNCRMQGAFVLAEKTCNYLLFEHNLVMIPMQFYGAVSGGTNAKGFTFRNNVIKSNDCLALSFYESGVLIEKNTLIYTLVANTGYSRGISLTGCTGPFTVRNNETRGAFSPGIGINSSEASLLAERSGIYNNMISDPSVGISLEGSAGIDVAFNNILVSSPSGQRYGMMLLPGLPGVTIFNNNIAHKGTSGAGIYLNNNDPFNPNAGSQFSSDFNNIYTSFVPVAYCITNVSPFSAEYHTLPDYTAARNKEVHSLSTDPLYTSDSNLHVNNTAIRNKGQQAAWCTTDFDGDPRNPYKPDIGADEGPVVPIADLGNDSLACTSDSIVLRTAYHFNDAAYLWSTGDTTAQIKVSQSGIYWLKVSNANGYHIDSVNIQLPHLPAGLLSLGKDSVGCDVVRIGANVTGNGYQWSTGDTTQFINVITTGQYVLRLKHSSGCYLSDTVQLTLYRTPVFSLGKDTNICQPAAFSLHTPVTADRYTWSTGDTANNIVISAPGVYALKAINGNTCATTDSITITFSPKPVVNLGRDTTFCSGNKLQLYTGNPGAKYQWSTGDTTASIKVGATGTYIVKVTDQMGCTGNDTLVATVIAVPGVNLGRDTMLCSGNSMVLSGGTGSAYQWSTGDTTASVTVSAAGTYILKISNASCSSGDTVVVGIAPVPVVNLGPDTAFCAGNTFLLDALNPGAAYLWSTGSNTQTIVVNSTQKVWVRVRNVFGCSASDTTYVTVNPFPVAAFTIDSSNSPVMVFSNHSLNAANYLWDFGDQDTSSVPGPVHAYGVSGTYVVKLLAVNACGADSMAHTIRVIRSGVNNAVSEDHVSIYPNPATDVVHIRLEGILKTDLELYDMSSRRICVPVQPATGGFIINTGSLSGGTYTLLIRQNNAIVTRKLVIVK